MNRRRAIQLTGGVLLGSALVNSGSLSMLKQLVSPGKTPRMPLLFIGHGSPMNAIDTNNYTKALAKLGQSLLRPRLILVVSAHWLTSGTWVTAMQSPKTIHDFYGFPPALFEVQYPAPGSPELANLVQQLTLSPGIQPDLSEWGLDHGTWSVLRHLYPAADIPVVQLSLDMGQPPSYHFGIGQQLGQLREQGVLVIGSGNLVHNLRQLRWEAQAKPFDWAIEYDQWIKAKLIARDFTSLTKNFKDSLAAQFSHPTWEHYFPLLYILGASAPQDELTFEYEEIQNASISMRSFRLG